MTSRRILAPLVLASLVLMAFTQTPAGETLLVILHSNDTHGHLLPFSYPTIVPDGSELADLPVRREIGGIARRAALAAKIRADVAARGGTTWLVDVGDFTDGTPFSTEYKGDADVAAMNAAGYQFATIGNHEFNSPHDRLLQLLKQPAYPLVLANAILKATGTPILPPYRIERVGSARVALFGLITRSTQGYPAARDTVVIADAVETAKTLVPALRAEADLVVLLSHSGEDVDEQIARQVPGIDVIVGGHSHSRIPTGTFVWQSDDLQSDGHAGTIIVQAHQWGGELGRLDLLLRRGSNGQWTVARHRSRLIPITREMPEDPAVAAIVQKFWQPIADRYGKVVGAANADVSARGDDEAPYALVADAVRETVKADFGLENSGGVRAPLVAGPITYGDLVTMDPFNNTVVEFTATGAQIRALLVRHAPHPSGLRYRLVDGRLVEATIGGQPIQDDRVYAGVTNSYFASVALKDVTTKDTGRARLDVLVEYIRAKGTITPAYAGRRVVMGRRSSSN